MRRKLWRSLGELARDRGVTEARAREFAPGADEIPDALARRDVLRLAGAGAALAGASACDRAPRGHVRPYVVEPAEAVPGNPLFFATSMTIDGYAVGLVAESHEGRPTKIEGNPEHPASLGGAGPLEQASVLDLYDPDRAQEIMLQGQPRSWSAFTESFASRLSGARAHLLLEATSSPVVADQIARMRARWPLLDVRWHAPLAPTAAWEGARIAFGRVLEPRIHLDAARVIVALDGDFLVRGPAWRVLARQFADGRRVRRPNDAMNRLYVAEPALSVTGMNADHRLRARAGDIVAVAARLTMTLADAGLPIPAELLAPLRALAVTTAAQDEWVRAAARDLSANRGASIVLIGDGQPAAIHALAHAINAALGNSGRTVEYAPSPIVDAGSDAFDLAPLAAALEAGEVDVLGVLGGNPAYDSFADLELARRFGAARESVYLGRYVNETARACRWFLPQAHYLESWGDARSFDGTVSLTQPLRMAAGERRTTSEVLSALLGEAREPAATSRDLLVAHWRRARQDFDPGWNRWVERGMIPGTATETVATHVQVEGVRGALARLTRPDGAGLEVTLRPDACVHDGAQSNNAWLMEMPDPVTRLTWGNAALLSRATAARLGVADGDVLRLAASGRTIDVPALVVPGHADETIAVALGYGHTGDGESIARGVGASGYALRTTGAPWFARIEASRTGGLAVLALEQVHSSLEGRDEHVLLHRTLDEYRADPTFTARSVRKPLALYTPAAGGRRQWGMVIDLNACTGCGACVVACQAENNVPVVGKAGVAKGRAMHWLRIDRYFTGEPDEPRVFVEPMLCQHCEKAPCEYVCPVNATTHSADGLNQMVYNRCVGTRFCSNNCPYKVRRFNWFDYHQEEAAGVALVRNPDVTVRARGVMEKCTYCVQRIREAEIRAEVRRRPLVDGDVVTACEQACPSRAITFGDVADGSSRVAKLRETDRGFAVLGDLGTLPRTRYLARIVNPNPELA